MEQPSRVDFLASFNKKKSILIAASIVFIIFFAYFFLLIDSGVKTDIQIHASMAHSFANHHDRLTPNFLYYFLVALVSGFSDNYPAYYWSSILMVSAAVTAKLCLNHSYISKYADMPPHWAITWGLSFAMLFVISLPSWDFFRSQHFYLGQLTPNVWHNSTTIFVMPFAMLLFFKSYELLFSDDVYHNKNLLTHITLLIVINALIKPSFLFTLLPSVFIIFCYGKFSNATDRKTSQLLPYLFGIIFIAAEYYVIYKLNYASSVAERVSGDDGKASIILAPFEVWRHFSENTLITTIASLFFPLLYLSLSKGNPLKNKLVQFASANFIIGLGTWILFAEDGVRKFHANFIWQVVITTYLLFFSLLLNFINDIKLNKVSRNKQLIIGSAFALHFIWGAVYWIRIIALKNYY